MMPVYVIIGYVILILYSVSITLRYISLHAEHNKQKIHVSLHEVIHDIKSMIHKEEPMDKGAYKNSRSSEYIDSATLNESVTRAVETIKTWNSSVVAPNLTQLLTAKPTNMDYERILDLIAQLFKLTYNEYKFYVAKSSDETKAPNFLQVTSPSTEHTELHKQIFRSAVNCGIDIRTLQEKFAERVALGQVVDLGEGVVIITDDGTPQLPTGVSPIQSGLEGSEITFIISFLQSSNYDEWKKNTFPEPEPPQENTDGQSETATN